LAALIISDVDEVTLEQISRLARRHDRSVEQETLSLIRQALGTSRDRAWILEEADRIAALTPKGVPQTDSVELLREDRDR